MEEKKIKYYKRSNGEEIEMSTLNTEHLINGYSKKYRDIFTSTNKDEFFERINEIKDIQEELYKRLNIYGETLGDSDGE